MKLRVAMLKVTAVMAVSVLVLTGCGTSGGNEKLKASSGSDPVKYENLLVDSAMIKGAYANPLDPILFPDQVTTDVITSAFNSKLAQCMKDRGFPEFIGEAGKYVRSRPVDAKYVYGIVDPQAAAIYGTKSQMWIETVTRPGEHDPVLPSDYFHALFGQNDKVEVKNSDGIVIGTYDPDSCEGVAKDAYLPHWAEEEYLVDLAWGILRDIPSDSSIEKEANLRWSECMKVEGFNFSSQNDFDFPNLLPTPEEIKVGVAAANCMQSTGALRDISKYDALETYKRLEKYPGIVTRFNEIDKETLDTVKSAQ